MNFSEHTTEDLKAFVARCLVELGEATAELARRATPAERGHEGGHVGAPLSVGVEAACTTLGMDKDLLYRLERNGKIPFACGTSRKDHRYNYAGMVEWSRKQRAKRG